MNVFEYSLSDKDIDEIIYYLAEASKRSGIPEDANPMSECDSCEKYYQLYHSLIVARDSIVKGNGKEVEVQIVPPKDSDPNADNGIIPTKVDPPQYNAEYYRFEITGYGWYNIDDLIQGRFGSVRSSLSVILKENHTERINIFLIIPSLKIFQEGGYLEDLESLGFYDINGEIFLPQNVTAFVIGISEYDGKLYYGQTQFFTSLHQKINLSLNETTKEMMMHSLQFLKFNNLNLKIDTTKNFSSIKAIDDELKKIGLKNAGCDCNNSDTTNDIE